MMARCKTCGAPVNLAPDGDPKYEPPLQTPNRAYLEAVRALGEARPYVDAFHGNTELVAKIDAIIGPEVKG